MTYETIVKILAVLDRYYEYQYHTPSAIPAHPFSLKEVEKLKADMLSLLPRAEN